MFDGIIGAGTWQQKFQQSFDRWEELSGATYVFEPNDDGVVQGTSDFPGILGLRADMRIAGTFLSGNGGVLAFNNFPNNGDMTMDTGDTFFYSDATNDFRALRNVVMHEHGHGAGILHVESGNANFLMEPFIQVGFDGPQFDDILAIQRQFGDVLEKTNGGAGNDTPATAFDFGTLLDGDSAVIGTDAGGLPDVDPNQTDFVSIDDDSDLDFFSFTVTNQSTVDLVLSPRGSRYRQGPQGGGQTRFNTTRLSDLNLTIFDTNGLTQLDFADDTGLGESESLMDVILPAAGTYYARVGGAQSNIQMYALDLTVAAIPEPGGLILIGLSLLGLLARRTR